MNRRAAVVLGVTPLVLGGLLLAGPGGASRSAVDTGGAMFSSAERDALNAAPVDPGAPPPGPDPHVDFGNAAVVAATYLVAGYSLVDSDAGRTNRRATGYAAPGTPPGEIGVLPLSTPAPGHHLVVAVTDVTQVGGEPSDTRRGYLVGYRGVDVPAATPAPTPDDPRFSDVARQTRYLVLARRFDGRWLVVGDSADAQVSEP